MVGNVKIITGSSLFNSVIIEPRGDCFFFVPHSHVPSASPYPAHPDMFMCVLSLRVKHLVMFWFGERGGIKGENVAGEKVRTGRGDGGTIYLFM